MTTKDQVAQIIVNEARTRGHSRDECLAEMSALYQESGWDETIWDPTHTTYGVAQQDGSYPHRFDGAAAQVKAFFDKLDVKRNSPGHGDIWLNICWLQQAPNWPSAQYWYDHGRRAYLDEIKSRIDTVTPYLNKYWPAAGGSPVTTPTDPNRPDYNEYGVYGDNFQDRGGTKIDLWLIHTEEGDMNADALAHWMNTTSGESAVSYHYTGSEDPNDHGVTICDVVDTDYASWSVLDANDRAINFCFAGSYASWTRDEWMQQSKCITAAAYLCVQDCIKYSITPNVIAPPYAADPPGISDHRYVTKHLGVGTHVDVGDGFPWDFFASEIAKFWALAHADGSSSQPPAGTPLSAIPSGDAATRLLLEQQLGPWDDTQGRFTGWPQLSGDPDALKVLQGKVDAGVPLSQVDALAALRFNITPSKTPKAVCAPAKKKPAKRTSRKAR
ncbi:hypothetical protein A5677_00505 [Mycobacterium malmoense]|uniref:N-acetylmuramoyl-L-alanine amidase domain-containing protein n=1 Tax=Mycobacterium malmoense TaxID=1780 RepID=A0A1B9CI68_MYCMA|nr:N-acetylmuramoyl-L-alanine amidase [Mycobacterium malmoense]OCB41887.1 hypothetical protein A5677_00505 [Mycobacterium malmoense]